MTQWNEVLPSLPLGHAKIFLVKCEPTVQASSPIAKLNIDDSVIDLIGEVVTEFFGDIRQKIIVEMTNLDTQDEEYVLTLPLEEIPAIQEAIEKVNTEQYLVPGAHTDLCTEYLKGLKYYMIEIQFEDKKCFLFKRYSMSNLISPKKFMLFCRENTFEKVDNTQMISLDPRPDALIIDNQIYVVNDKQFSLATGYYERERRSASTMLDAIAGNAVIANFPQLREECESRISYMKKLSKVDPSNLNKITFQKVMHLKQERDIDIVLDECNQQISFENNTQLRNIVDLILDNFVTSAITETPYRAVNKMREHVS